MRRGRRPGGGRRALLRRLEVVVDQVALVVDPAEPLHLLAGHVPLQRGQDAAGVHGERADARILGQRVQVHREQRVRGLGLAVGGPLLVAVGEVDVVPPDR